MDRHQKPLDSHFVAHTRIVTRFGPFLANRSASLNISLGKLGRLNRYLTMICFS